MTRPPSRPPGHRRLRRREAPARGPWLTSGSPVPGRGTAGGHTGAATHTPSRSQGVLIGVWTVIILNSCTK